MVRSILCSLIVVVASAGAAGQAGPLAWERVTDLENLTWLTFDADTLYVVQKFRSPRTLRRAGEGAPFVQAFAHDTGAAGLVKPGGDSLLYRGNGYVYLSPDGGASWEVVIAGRAYSDPVVLPSGTVLVGTRGNEDGQGSLALRSTDRGATWSFVGLGNEAGIGTAAFVVVPPSAGAPAGAVVAAGFNGVAYSTDDGRTWTASSLYGALAYASDTAALVAGTGRVVAIVGANMGGAEVVASEDGGATWTPLGPPPGVSRLASRLVATPDGALYLYEVYGDDDDREGRSVWRSVDGGATWADMGPVWTAWSVVPRAMAVGPDRRLYTAAGGKGGTVGAMIGGLFRTVDPVWAVATERSPGASGLSVSVRPNPAAGRASVTVTVGAPRRVRVTVVDALGREVAVVYEGAGTGGQRLAVETAALTPGAYRVVVRADGATASAGLAVVR